MSRISRWVGFDMDHTLVKYNLKELTELVRHCIIDYLSNHVKNGPINTVVERALVLLNELDVSKKQPFTHHFGQKGTIIDKQTGNVIKLDANGRVCSAFHGINTKLTSGEIADLYGQKQLANDEFFASSRWYMLLSYFDTPCAAAVACMVEARDELKVDVTYCECVETVHASLAHCFLDYDTGAYFPSLKNYPDRYLYDRSAVKQWLSFLRGRGFKLVLLTNSLAQYTNNTMKFAFGNDWADLFDIVVVCGRKPVFFMNSSACFYSVSENFEEIGTSPIRKFDGNETLLFGGNINDLHKIMTDTSMIYVGDNVLSDILVPKRCGWKVIGVVEEMLFTPKYVDLDTYNTRIMLDDAYNSTAIYLKSSDRYWNDSFLQSFWFNICTSHCEVIVADIHVLAMIDQENETSIIEKFI